MTVDNQVSLARMHRIWTEEGRPESSFYISLPVPCFRSLGETLWDLEVFDDNKPADLDLRRTTFVHTTLCSPRPFESGTFLDTLTELVDGTKSWQVTLHELDAFRDINLIVGMYEDKSELQVFHKNLIGLEGFPTGDPTFEGEHYNPHVTMAKSPFPDRDLPFLRERLMLPYTWSISRLDVHVRLPGVKRYHELGFLLFS